MTLFLVLLLSVPQHNCPNVDTNLCMGTGCPPAKYDCSEKSLPPAPQFFLNDRARAEKALEQGARVFALHIGVLCGEGTFGRSSTNACLLLSELHIESEPVKLKITEMDVPFEGKEGPYDGR